MIGSARSAWTALRALPTAVLPWRDGDPSFATPVVPSEADSPTEIARCAESLAVPWKRILLGEIEAEQRLRRYLADTENDCPLPLALSILPFSFLQSWRVRDQIQSLACQARGDSDRGAVRRLRFVIRHLTGKADRDHVALAEHLWLAYQRVLLLQRVCRAAARSRGTLAERLAYICSTTRCCYDDASWAVNQEDSPRRGHRLDTAVRKVRDEGFLIPRAETEPRSVAELRLILRAFPRPVRRPSARRSPDLLSAQRRHVLPVDSI